MSLLYLLGIPSLGTELQGCWRVGSGNKQTYKMVENHNVHMVLRHLNNLAELLPDRMQWRGRRICQNLDLRNLSALCGSPSLSNKQS